MVDSAMPPPIDVSRVTVSFSVILARSFAPVLGLVSPCSSRSSFFGGLPPTRPPRAPAAQPALQTA